MRFVGVDLAWGRRGSTGLAVLDDDGALLDVTTARSDDEIVAWMHTWAPGACVVAIDAPLVVPNATGMRDCERLVPRYFPVSCHAANTGNPAFDPPRAAQLAARLGLCVDPAAPARRRALEVYPHTALLALFDLPRVVQYKAKPGRDVAHLRTELLRVLALLESLATAAVPMRVAGHDGWGVLRAAAEGAVRKVDLRRIEDAVDGVVCAYVARYLTLHPDAVRVLGDVTTGYIVTPVPADVAARIDADLGPTLLA